MMTRNWFRRATQGCASQAGVALIETLVAMMVFSLGVLCVVALLTKALQFSTDSEDRTRAAMLASELAATMWQQKNADLDSATILAWQNRVQASGSGLPSMTVTSHYDQATKMATITIDWKSPWLRANEQSHRYMTQVVIP